MFLIQLISLQSFKPSKENKKKGRRFNGVCKEFSGRFSGRGGRGGGGGFGGHGGRGGGGFGGRVGGDTRVGGGRSR